jgi:hypothetical protein
MWEIATQVSTGIALAAFLAVAGLYAYMASLKSRLKIIQALPAEARGDALAKELNAFSIDGRGLTREQQFRLAGKEIELRRARLASITAIIIVLAVISGLIAAISVWSAPAEKGNTGALAPQRVLWAKNLDAMRQTDIGMGSSEANSCGYRHFVHRETFENAIRALVLTEAPDLNGIRAQLLASVDSMHNSCGSDDWYDLPLSTAMQDLHAKLEMGVRARAIEAGVHVPK